MPSTDYNMVNIYFLTTSKMISTLSELEAGLVSCRSLTGLSHRDILSGQTKFGPLHTKFWGFLVNILL